MRDPRPRAEAIGPKDSNCAKTPKLLKNTLVFARVFTQRQLKSQMIAVFPPAIIQILRQIADHMPTKSSLGQIIGWAVQIWYFSAGHPVVRHRQAIVDDFATQGAARFARKLQLDGSVGAVLIGMFDNVVQHLGQNDFNLDGGLLRHVALVHLRENPPQRLSHRHRIAANDQPHLPGLLGAVERSREEQIVHTFQAAGMLPSTASAALG